MYSTLTIYNLALSRLGGNELSSVESVGEESRLASLCNTFFPHVRDMALSAHAWGFAMTETDLGLAKESERMEEGQFRHVYQLPMDCLKPIRLVGGGSHQQTPFVIRGRLLCCDEGEARLQYIFRAQDPTVWPVYFADIVIWGLAAELSTAYVNDVSRQKFCLECQKTALERGIIADAVSMKPKKNPCVWDMARG